MGYDRGADRLILRYPQTVTVPITTGPLAPWANPTCQPEDSGNVELVVVVEGIMYANAANMMRSKTYRIPDDIRYGHGFSPIVARSPHGPRDAIVDWAAFHTTRDADAQLAAQRSASVSRRPATSGSAVGGAFGGVQGGGAGGSGGAVARQPSAPVSPLADHSPVPEYASVEL